MATTKKAKQSTTEEGASVLMSVDLLDPRPNNARKKITKESLTEMMKTIKESGFHQPLLIRPKADARYEIVDGERRWRSAGYLKLSHLPVFIREMDDEQAADSSARANLQRLNLHPLEEADLYQERIESANGDIPGVARRLGKSVKEIRYRLTLTNLIPGARADFEQGLIGVEHAMELGKLSQDVQADALDACYDTKWTPEGHKPDKSCPPRHHSNLKRWIQEHMLLDLAKAPFKLTDNRLHPDSKVCEGCADRTSEDPTLFEELAGVSDRCRNRKCFEQKRIALVKIEAKRIAPKDSEIPAPLLAPHYGYQPAGELKDAGLEIINRGEFTAIVSAKEKCASAERGVWPEGTAAGKASWFCRNPQCPDHAGRFFSRSRGKGSGEASAAELRKKRKRRQEIFDIKVAERSRRRVYGELLQKWTQPFELDDLKFIAKGMLERIPSEHGKVICKVKGWDYNDLSDHGKKDSRKVLKRIDAMEMDEVIAFMRLMTVIDYGTDFYFKADKYADKLIKQDEVEALAAQLGVNYELIDAEERVKECESGKKKYIPAHEEYLQGVQAGGSPAKPKVYDTSKAKPKASGKAKANEAATEPEENERVLTEANYTHPEWESDGIEGEDDEWPDDEDEDEEYFEDEEEEEKEEEEEEEDENEERY
jgi:ParB/RepB/Spo0J family partition protein